MSHTKILSEAEIYLLKTLDRLIENGISLEDVMLLVPMNGDLGADALAKELRALGTPAHHCQVNKLPDVGSGFEPRELGEVVILPDPFGFLPSDE